jgi:hypothetical protein
MALYVLPLAFLGMGAGYYLGVKKYPEKKLLLGAMGYLIGFQAGFQVVLWLAFPTSSGISSLAYLVGLAMIGVIVAFLISKIGSREVNNGMDPTPNDNHPLGQIHAFNRINNPQSQDLRIGVILALALVLGITLVIPFFSF